MSETTDEQKSPELMTKWCRMDLHKFFKWETVRESAIFSVDKEGKKTGENGYYILQKRICSSCNFIELRKLEEYV